MEIDINKLKQLDRIEYRQQREPLNNFKTLPWIFFTYTLSIILGGFAMLFKELGPLYEEQLYVCKMSFTLFVICAFLLLLISFLDLIVKKIKEKKLNEEYFEVKPKK